jgi:hypothetical protein
MDRKLTVILFICLFILMTVLGIRFSQRDYNCSIDTYNTGFHGHLYGKDMSRGTVIIFILDEGRYCLSNGFDNRYKSDLYNFLEFGDTVAQKPLSKIIEIKRKGKTYYFRNNQLR